MSSQFLHELTQFGEFINDRLKSGKPLSPEEALDLWRAQNPISDDFDESVEAVKEALAAMEAGDGGRPFDEVIAEIRQRRNLPPRS